MRQVKVEYGENEKERMIFLPSIHPCLLLVLLFCLDFWHFNFWNFLFFLLFVTFKFVVLVYFSAFLLACLVCFHFCLIVLRDGGFHSIHNIPACRVDVCLWPLTCAWTQHGSADGGGTSFSYLWRSTARSYDNTLLAPLDFSPGRMKTVETLVWFIWIS